MMNNSTSQFLSVAPGKRVPLRSAKRKDDSVHVFESEAVLAINAAIAAGRPLLVRGEPGTGKTQLARAAAQELRRAFVTKTVDIRTEARDLLWTFDAVGRLAEAQVLAAADVGGDDLRDGIDESLFVRPGPLWWAFDWPGAEKHLARAKLKAKTPTVASGCSQENGVVVLIDEIDKADASVPNGLLEALGSQEFDVLGSDEGVVRKETVAAPLVIVTTNEERSLPDAFLRRCLVLQLRLPEDDKALIRWLSDRGKAHFPRSSKWLRDAAARQLVNDRVAVRKRGLSPPGQAEYLDLIRALARLPADKSDKRPLRERQEDLLEKLTVFTFEKHPSDSKER